MLTVTVDGVGAGVGVGEGAAGGAAVDVEPPPPQLASRIAPAMAMPVPEKREVFMLMHEATSIPGANSAQTTTCVILDYRAGKDVSEIVEDS
jgi:hypothetical protein